LADTRLVTDALARASYLHDQVRIANADLAGFEVLVTSRQGMFAVASDGKVERIAWGSFFGIRRHGGFVYAFEACDRTSNPSAMGRIVRFCLRNKRMKDPQVLVRGLDNNCHQIAIIGEVLHVVDTANQQVLLFTLAGNPIATKPVHPSLEELEGENYRHVNSIASIGGRIGLLLHNGGSNRDRPSELAWIDDDWNIAERQVLPGQACHDIVADKDGRIWHCGSRVGELITGDGLRVKVSPMFTRGLALAESGFVVGYSQVGTRADRQTLAGGVLFLDRAYAVRADLALEGAPTDLVLL
jgi:hypothetical protein